MKRLITLFILLSITYIASAIDKHFPDYRDIRMATQEDLMKLNLGNVSILGSAQNNHDFTYNFYAPVIDTLNEYYNRATKFMLYGFPDGGQILPLVGTNSIYYYAGQKFTYTISPDYAYTMTGVLIPLGINFQRGDYTDTNQIMVVPTDVQGKWLDNPFAKGRLFLSKADSNSKKPEFNYITFDSTGVVTEYFSVFLQTRNFQSDAETDIIAIWANNQGDGKSESRSYYLYYDQQWMLANFSDMKNVKMSDGLAPDFDIFIIPVIEKIYTQAVDEPVTINGITLKSIYPQPVAENANIALIVDKDINLRIDILDLEGHLVKTILDDRLAIGENTISFNTDGIASGTYLISIRSGNTGFAVKTAIVK